MQNRTKPLGPRLLSALPDLTPGGTLADVGTDHAYLPIEVVRRGISARAVACDVNRGPLARAEANIRAAGLSDRISLLLTDGLRGVERFCPDDVLVFGMGGELIVRILAAAPWLRSAGVGLILQPMSRAECLRRWLLDEGFEIRAERLSLEDGQYYQTVCARFGGAVQTYTPGELAYGRFDPGADPALQAGFCLRQLERLREVVGGKRRGGADTGAEEALAAELRSRLARLGAGQSAPAANSDREENPI